MPGGRKLIRAGVAAVLLLAAALAGCTSSPQHADYGLAVARIGDDYHLFVPLCPGEQVVQVRVQRSDGGRKVTWWEAAGPKAAAGPGEWLVLGDDEPFTDVRVGAAGAAPAELVVDARLIDFRGAARTASDDFARDVPVHPAGADPRTVTYRWGRDHKTHTVDEIRTAAGCAFLGNQATGSPAGLQPAGAIEPDARERAGRALSGADLGAAGLTETPPAAPPYQDGVASGVCDHAVSAQAFGSVFGRFRSWTAGGLRAEHWTGVYGAAPAAEQIALVRGALGCAGYGDIDGKHRGTHEVAVDEFAGVDGRLGFCETNGDEQARCTVLLSREDVLARLQVIGPTEAVARDLAARLAPVAAAALAKSW